MAYYIGNRCALSAIAAIARLTANNDEVIAQLELLREEVVQMRSFINEQHPENNLPIDRANFR